MNDRPSRIAIVGGGISGLATAFFLQRRAAREGRDLALTLIETAGRLGGKVRTDHHDGLVMEAGPDSFVTSKPGAYRLCRDLGLTDRLIATRPENRRVFVLKAGRLRPLPAGLRLTVPVRLGPFLASDLVSLPGKLRALQDLWLPPRREDGDESLARFVRRRFGDEMLATFAEPLMAGIYVADPERMSLRSTFGSLAQIERTHGSLIRGLRAQQRDATAGDDPPAPSLFMSLRGGLSELIEALDGHLRIERRLNTAVQRLTCPGGPTGPIRLHLSSGPVLEADRVVLTTPAAVSATLLTGTAPVAAAGLRALRTASSATVRLVWRRADVGHRLDGYGFVVPRGQDDVLLACTWVSSKFPYRAPDDQVLLRAFVGSERDPQRVHEPDETLIAAVRRRLEPLLSIRGRPLHASVTRWIDANCQYDVGHAERVAGIENDLRATLPAVRLTGCAYRGVGLPDCIEQARRTAEELWSETLARPAAEPPVEARR